MSDRPPHTVRVDSGKYTFVNRLGVIEILRHGEPWHEQTGAGNALSSIMAELDAARVVIAAARSYQRAGMLLTVPDIVKALDRHASLVSDSEPPSEWCGGVPA